MAERELDASRRNLAEIEVRLAEAQRNLERNEALVQAAAGQPDGARRLARRSERAGRAARGLAGAGQGRRERPRRCAATISTICKCARHSRAWSSPRTRSPGEMISPMSAGGGFTRTGIATIVDMDSREIEVDVNEAYINRVKAESARRGDARRLSGCAACGACHQHRAHRGSHQGDGARAHRLRQARAAHPARHGHQGALPGREAGAGRSASGPRIRVPSAAVQRIDGETYVWVVSEGRVERRAITIGAENDGQAEVLAGVNAGEELVSPLVRRSRRRRQGQAQRKQ